MKTPDPTARSGPEARLITRRGLITAGAGLVGVGGLMLTSTGAYAAAQAANDLVVTDYRLSPSNWPTGQRLTTTAIAGLHARRPRGGARQLFAGASLHHRTRDAAGVGGRACTPACPPRRVRDSRQSRL